MRVLKLRLAEVFLFWNFKRNVTAGLETGKDAIVVATSLKPKRLQIGNFILNEDISKRRKRDSICCSC